MYVDFYSAFIVTYRKGAQVWITQSYLQTTPIPILPLPRKCSPDGATTDCSGRHLIAVY